MVLPHARERKALEKHIPLNAAMPSAQQKQEPEINIENPIKPPTNSGVQNPHCVPHLQMCNATTPSEKEHNRQCENPSRMTTHHAWRAESTLRSIPLHNFPLHCMEPLLLTAQPLDCGHLQSVHRAQRPQARIDWPETFQGGA